MFHHVLWFMKVIWTAHHCLQHCLDTSLAKLEPGSRCFELFLDHTEVSFCRRIHSERQAMQDQWRTINSQIIILCHKKTGNKHFKCAVTCFADFLFDLHLGLQCAQFLLWICLEKHSQMHLVWCVLKCKADSNNIQRMSMLNTYGYHLQVLLNGDTKISLHLFPFKHLL